PLPAAAAADADVPVPVEIPPVLITGQLESTGDLANTPDQANPIQLTASGTITKTWTASREATLDGPQDTDWLRLDAPASGSLRIDMHASSSLPGQVAPSPLALAVYQSTNDPIPHLEKLQLSSP